MQTPRGNQRSAAIGRRHVGSVPEMRRYISEASGGARFFQLHGHDVKTWAGNLSFFFPCFAAVGVEGGGGGGGSVRIPAGDGEQQPLSCSTLRHHHEQKPPEGIFFFILLKKKKKVPPSHVITTQTLPPQQLIHVQLIAIAVAMIRADR